LANRQSGYAVIAAGPTGQKSAAMTFKQERPLASVDVAELKLLELANAIEPDYARRIAVGVLNRQFIDAGGDVAEYGNAMQAAIGHGYLEMHPPRGYVSFTQAGLICSHSGTNRPAFA
jgi:hypothetical protein